MLGPLAEILKALERVQKAARDTQSGINDMVTSLRGAGRVANSFADAMERASRASRNFRAPKMGAGGFGGGGSSSGSGGAASPAASGGGSSSASGGGYTGPAYLLNGPAPMLALGAPPPTMALPAPSGVPPLLLNGPVGGGGWWTGAWATGARPNFTMPGANAGAPGQSVPNFGMPPGGVPLNVNPAALPYAPTTSEQGLAALHKGAMPLWVGEMVISGVEHLTLAGAGLNDEIVKLQAGGMSEAQANAFGDLAVAIALRVPGVNVTEATKHGGELRALLGEDRNAADPLGDAKAVLPDFEVTAQALHAKTGFDANKSMMLLAKAVELQGGLIDPKTGHIDKDRFTAALNEAYKTLVAAQGLIKPEDFLNLMKQAGPMARLLPPEVFDRIMMAAVIDQGGHRTGTALTALGRQFLGGKMTFQTATEVAKIFGLPEDSFEKRGAGVEWTDDAQSKVGAAIDAGPMALAERLKEGMKKRGITTTEGQQKELYKVLGTETGRRLIALFLANAEQVLRDAKLQQSVPPPSEALKLLSDKSIAFNIDALSTSISNFWQVIEKIDAGNLTATMRGISSFIDNLTYMLSHSPFSKEFWLGRDFDPAIQRQSYAPGGSSGGGVLRVWVENMVTGSDIARGASANVTRTLSRPQSGTSGGDLRMNPYSPVAI